LRFILNSNMDLSNFKYKEENLPKDHNERNIFFEKLREEIKAELKQDEALKKYVEKFQSADLDDFILYIAERKIQIVSSQNWIIQSSEHTPEIKYRKEAERAIELIQQKKLFNIQCLWRANQFEHPLLRCTYDFHFWETHIHDCPFLDPVSPEEIQLMQSYLRMPNSELTQFGGWSMSFQDYESILETEGATEDYIYMPEWYEFYDGFRGTSYLLKLPNLRGQQEDDLRDAWQQDRARKEKENPTTTQYVTDIRPYFNVFSEVDNYFKNFEKDNFLKELNSLYRAEQQAYMDTEDMDFDWALEILKEANEPVYMVGGKEWKEAIKETAVRFINLKVADDLDLLYEADALFNELDISTVKDDLTKEILEHSQQMVDRLKKAALLTGTEPDKYW